MEEPRRRVAKLGGCKGSCGAERGLCTPGWQHGQKVPPELYVSLKPSSRLEWLVTPWLVSAPDLEEEDISVSQVSPDTAAALRGAVPTKGFCLPLPPSQHPRGAVPGCRAGLAGGCCAGPAPLPALLSLWKSQSLLQIQLWFWGQPSPSPSLSLSFLFPPSALLPPPLPPSSPHCTLRGLWVPLQHHQPPPAGRLGPRGGRGGLQGTS